MKIVNISEAKNNLPLVGLVIHKPGGKRKIGLLAGKFTIPDNIMDEDPEMNSEIDIRWQQRFKNYKKALAQLRKFISKGELSELEKQGLIKAFEYTYELAWTTLKDFLEYQGHSGIYGSRDAIRKAFELNLVQDGQSWMDMLQSRRKTSHTYNEEIAQGICQAVQSRYFQLLERLEETMETLQQEKGSI
jgi:nucleotidyltransferase substrate binding protein (TIGR01987 family)